MFGLSPYSAVAYSTTYRPPAISDIGTSVQTYDNELTELGS